MGSRLVRPTASVTSRAAASRRPEPHVSRQSSQVPPPEVSPSRQIRPAPPRRAQGEGLPPQSRALESATCRRLSERGIEFEARGWPRNTLPRSEGRGSVLLRPSERVWHASLARVLESRRHQETGRARSVWEVDEAFYSMGRKITTLTRETVIVFTQCRTRYFISRILSSSYYGI